MNQLVVLAVVAALAGGGVYFGVNSKVSAMEETIKGLNDTIKDLRTRKTASYGQLSRVNRVELAKVSVQFDCLAKKKIGLTTGEINFFWDFEYAYGVDIPNQFAWDIQDIGNGTAAVTLPPLQQLRPVMVEFYKALEVNNASGKKWEAMIFETRDVAKEWLIAEGNNKLNVDSNLLEEARASMESHLLPLINQANPNKQYTSLSVKFEDEPKPSINNNFSYPQVCKKLDA